MYAGPARSAGPVRFGHLPAGVHATTLPRSVKDPPSDLAGRLGSIRGRIADAAARSGRSPDAVTLIGVVKTVAPERMRLELEAGLTDLGENRVQEAGDAVASLGRSGIRWHLIGHLQRNKVARAVGLFDRIHTIDSIERAQAISKYAVAAGLRIPVLVQVNISGEASKHGVDPTGLHAVLSGVASLEGVALDGLMSIGRPGLRPEDARAEFARTRELRDRAEAALGIALPHLSMGMSDDFEVAVEEGSTMVRVGSALFGPRET